MTGRFGWSEPRAVGQCGSGESRGLRPGCPYDGVLAGEPANAPSLEQLAGDMVQTGLFDPQRSVVGCSLDRGQGVHDRARPVALGLGEEDAYLGLEPLVREVGKRRRGIGDEPTKLLG